MSCHLKARCEKSFSRCSRHCWFPNQSFEQSRWRCRGYLGTPRREQSSRCLGRALLICKNPPEPNCLFRLQLYATLFEVIESFMAEACVLSDGLSEFHQEFSKHLATFSTETMLRTLPFPTYLRSEVQQRAHATRRPAAPRQ